MRWDWRCDTDEGEGLDDATEGEGEGSGRLWRSRFWSSFISERCTQKRSQEERCTEQMVVLWK
jgi:hypothetical protein